MFDLKTIFWSDQFCEFSQFCDKFLLKLISKPSVASVATNLFNLNSLNPIKPNINYSHKINFLLDTGASCHFVNDKSLFIKYKDENSSVILADSSIPTSQGIGTILWKTIDKNQKAITIKLNNVRMVPNLKQNLLSLSALFQQPQSGWNLSKWK